MDMDQLQKDYTAVLNMLQKNDNFPATTEMSALSLVRVKIDPLKYATPDEVETAIHAADSRTQIWVVPTNEELIVARQTYDVLTQS